MLKDDRGLEVSTTSPRALEGYERALALLNLYRADPFAEIEAVLEETPGFAMGHVFRAGLLASAMEAGTLPELRRSLAALESMAGRMKERELAHAGALRAWADGTLLRARTLYQVLLQRWPRDLFALQVLHQLHFFLGDRLGLRDMPRAVLPAWREEEAGAGLVHGMLAFGLEECGDYAGAEAAGRRAVAQQPGDAWAIHAVAHVMEMQGRAADGAQWLSGRTEDWAPDGMLAVHNWWHLALFHLDGGGPAAAMAVFERGVRRRAGAAPAIELVDVSAMLWRFSLLGLGSAEHWAEASDLWAAQEPGFYAFNDVHAVMAHLGAGRQAEAERVMAAMRQATGGSGTNAMMSSDVGLPLARGLMEFAAGRFAEAAALLAPLPLVAHRFGGSHAQRDVIALTQVEAAIRAGEGPMAERLVAERLRAKPHSAVARGLATRAMAA
jgi:hypothetical protein